MKPIWKIVIVVVVIFAVLAALLIVPHYRAKAALRAYREQLKRQGEKLTVTELIPALSSDATGAGRELLAAVGMAANFTNSPPMMKWLAPGHALVGWSETISPTENVTNCWPEFAEVVKGHPEVSAQITTALQKPEIGFVVQYQQGYNALLPFLAPMKRLSLWIGGSATLALHEQDQAAAWTALSQEADLLKKYDSEPIMISQLVRASMVQIGIAVTWEALQSPGWSEQQLAQLQNNWAAFSMMERGASALSMDRTMQETGFEHMRKSYKVYSGVADSAYSSFDSFDQVLMNPQDAVPGFLGQYPRYWMWRWWGSYDEDLYLSQLFQAALETMRSVQKGAAFVPALDDFYRQADELKQKHPGSQRRFVFARRLEPVVGNYLKRIGEAEMARRMMVIALALERYRRLHGKYPERLEELAPDILKNAPVDFMDGKPLRYRRTDDGKFLMYSVGLDGKDDGGDGTSTEPEGLRPKTWSRMRDAVWPTPATPEEVKKYEAEMLQKYSQRWPRGKVPPPRRIPAPAGTNSKTN